MADIYSLGVVMVELCVTHHPLYPFHPSGIQEMHDARPTQLPPKNPMWSIPEDFQDVLDMCLSYDSKNRPSAQALTLHNGLATCRVFVLQHLLNPGEYESAIQEIERLPAQLTSSSEK